MKRLWSKDQGDKLLDDPICGLPGNRLRPHLLTVQRRIDVHRLVMFTVIVSIFASLMPIAAEGFTYGMLIAGQVGTALVHGSGTSWCFVGDGSTEFQINQAGSKGVISFPELTYFDGANYYELNGQTILTFSSATGGNIHFTLRPNLPNTVHNPVFTNFIQTYNTSTDQLDVSFNIVFPACTLPVNAVYDAP